MDQDHELSLTQILLTTLSGMKATALSALQPEVTEYYPEQRPQLPWGARGQLYVDVLDCISCYKCAKACPSDCIRIDSVRAPAGTLSDTTDGHKRTFEVVRFDIDMGKCCYCGLCTGRSSWVAADSRNDLQAQAYVDRSATCPTDCINFYPRFENGSEDAADMLYHFASYSFDEAASRWHALQADKRRSTHPGMPESEYGKPEIPAVPAPAPVPAAYARSE